MELPNLKCSRCNKEYNSYNGLAKHATRTHKVTPADLQVEIYHNNIWPTCACGCGEKLEFGTSTPGKFAKYKGLHFQKTREGGFQTKEGLEKSAQTRRERFASGEIKQWNKGKKESELYSPEIIAKRLAANKSEARREKISKALKGKEKSPEQKKRLAEMSVFYRKKRQLASGNKLEKAFEEILNEFEITYFHQHTIKNHNYDFFIPTKNLLIEVDGDFWHVNESKGFTIKSKIQVRNLENDAKKNDLAKREGYTLLRFWENDIKNNKQEVVRVLLDHLK
jgi:very-short-patch-repair endonuclease